ncbi:acetoin catabolism protein [Desulforapulum autotrophicum HRM2]|uniref:Acetoin catabolism protein n=1 Tax=Desulforapulum autotrophicum (strain ATCC 43914 / DSM 3382 / VKM B-1955 / HRM2) TaxID=177437 RepID=C0QHF0_DESAH|nr:NAD(+)/NADH kinase [Desulforapulum autotrophicum]ACN17809.1 acetoin catabolism protein [Desulforapulum autotrophicum HRM2]
MTCLQAPVSRFFLKGITVLTTVGIIANPVSGKDIRRLVAHGSVFDNQEKVRMVRRILTGLAATGVKKVFYMPDGYAIVPRAVRGVSVPMEIVPIPMELQDCQMDSTNASRHMAEAGVRVIIVLGGDGTCRAVSKGNDTVPMLPLSTGTNNVFPYMIEATVGGLAAGFVATGQVPLDPCVYRSSRLEIIKDEKIIDIALVDVAVYNDRFIASRAIWDMDKVLQIFLTRARPDSIGLSALGGQLTTITPHDHRGLHLLLGNGGDKRVTAAIAPGLLGSVWVKKEEIMQVKDALPVETIPCVLALDGEREVEVKKGDTLTVWLSDQGPLVIDLAETMAFSQKKRLMVKTSFS